MADPAEAAAMRRALELGTSVVGRTSPNPPVGAVVLDAAGEVAGEGATAPPGGPHAEVVALAAAGPQARGGSAVVTLEPCAHHGRTGPCVDALLAAGIARVVFAVPDPTPAAGGGADRLRAAGVDTARGLLAAEAARGALRPWLHAARHGRPYVLWKLAATLDGRAAAADRTSRWITGPPARADVHRLRARSDAVVVGVGTVLADDPLLTARDPAGRPLARQPLRVVLDAGGRTPRTARVLDGSGPTLLVTARELPDPPAETLVVPPGPGGRGVDLPAALAALHARGVVLALLEGGPTVAGAALRAGAVQGIVAYVAPALLGAGPSVLADAGIGTIADALRLRVDEVVRLGDDLRVTADVDGRD
jgi:diaminohydroxyphosphoribosylaminopyrimidine deaminase/5-amino-6-(5-phosphoribosylamino)uracil reductase